MSFLRGGAIAVILWAVDLGPAEFKWWAAMFAFAFITVSLERQNERGRV